MRGGRPVLRRGHTLLELVVTLVLFSTIIAATSALLASGQRQQTLGQDFSALQSDLRSGMRRATRTLRHGQTVVAASSATAFTPATSGPAQVIVRVPEPAGASASQVEVRFYLSQKVLYAQRSDQAAPGTPLMTGVDSLRFEYFRTSGATRSAVDSTPAETTDLRMTVTATKGTATTAITATVALRNALVSS